MLARVAQALREAQGFLSNSETIIAYLDDIYMVTSPQRARAAYDIVTNIVHRLCGVEANLGKTVSWNRAGGPAPDGVENLGPDVWQGDKPEAQEAKEKADHSSST